MKPAFRYFGGKGRLAPWIVSVLPPHQTYIEPFFGAGAVLLAKPKVRNELVNDLDGMVVNFYRVLRERPDDLIDALRLTPYARDEYRACKNAYGDDTADDLERARRFFVVVSHSFACTTGTSSGWSSSLKKTVNRARTTSYYIDRLPAIADRIEHVLIENQNAVRTIEKHGVDAGTVIYCDPPYVHDSRNPHSVTGGHGYRHEMTDSDHRELAAALHATPATVFLSGYHSDLYDELYADWPLIARETFSSLPGAYRRDMARTEVLWSNKPIHDGRLELHQAAS